MYLLYIFWEFDPKSWFKDFSVNNKKNAEEKEKYVPVSASKKEL